MKLRFKKLHPDAIMPEYAHKADAGADLYSLYRDIVQGRSWNKIATGIAVEIPEGYAGFVQPRSGLAIKYGLTVLNAPGLIDSHYRGDVSVIVMNHSVSPYTIEKHEKIAQLVIQKVENVEWIESEELSETTRGEGGFGSTGQ